MMRPMLTAFVAALIGCTAAPPATADPVGPVTRLPAATGQVVLDPSLGVPQPGDSAATVSARDRLAALIARVQQGQDLYDQAAAAVTAAQAALARARAVYAADQAAADLARAELVATAVRNYVTGIDAAPQLEVIATSPDPGALLDGLAVIDQIAAYQAASTHAADRAAAAAAAAKRAQAAAEAKAQDAQRQAHNALTAAQAAQGAAADLVLTAHLTDLRAQAAAAQRNAHTVTDAADALKAQSLATGAAAPADFAAARSPAAVIAVADAALLRQAAGRTPAPRAVPGSPPFAVPSFGPPTGPTPAWAWPSPARPSRCRPTA